MNAMNHIPTPYSQNYNESYESYSESDEENDNSEKIGSNVCFVINILNIKFG